MVVSVAVVAATVVVVSGGLAGDVWRGNDLGGCGAGMTSVAAARE